MKNIKKSEVQLAQQPENISASTPELVQSAKIYKTSHTIAAFIILLLFCAMVGGGTWWYLREMRSDSGTQADLTFKTGASTKEDEGTKDWKTFSSSEYGFSIKYPKDWVYKDYGKKPEGSKMVGFADKESNLAPEQSDGHSVVDIAMVEEAIKESSLTQHPDKLKKEEITIGNKISVIKWTLLPGRDNDFAGDSKLVMIEAKLENGKYAVITNTDDVKADIFERMLETFRFKK